MIAIDLLPMNVIPDVEFIQGDFTEQVVLDRLLSALQGKLADILISDMAPNLSGQKSIDLPRSIYLLELQLQLQYLLSSLLDTL